VTQASEIDRLLLSFCNGLWQKVAKIVGQTFDELPDCALLHPDYWLLVTTGLDPVVHAAVRPDGLPDDLLKTAFSTFCPAMTEWFR
jgi:hypothetical protein